MLNFHNYLSIKFVIQISEDEDEGVWWRGWEEQLTLTLRSQVFISCHPQGVTMVGSTLHTHMVSGIGTPHISTVINTSAG